MNVDKLLKVMIRVREESGDIVDRTFDPAILSGSDKFFYWVRTPDNKVTLIPLNQIVEIETYYEEKPFPGDEDVLEIVDDEEEEDDDDIPKPKTKLFNGRFA